MKVAEANEICVKLKNNLTFTITKAEGKSPVVTLNDSINKKVEPLSNKEFLRRYIALKEKSINTATYEKETNSTELKRVLIETMFLSQQLEEQMQLLRSRGLTSDSLLK